MFTLYENPTIKELLSAKEGQLFDRKGPRINRTSLVDHIIGFANADGGVLVIGIEKSKDVIGVQDWEVEATKIRKLSTSDIVPPLPIKIKKFECKNFKNQMVDLILLEVAPGLEVYSNLKDEAYLRIGDENIKLNFDQRSTLYDDRGKQNFERRVAEGATTEDLDGDLVQEYIEALKLPTIDVEDLLIGRDLAESKGNELKINMAGIVLFGKRPEKWVERARIRILKYEGNIEKTGQRLNVTKDNSIYGPLIKQIRETRQQLKAIFREFTYLNASGRFITQSEYPEFAWTEAIVNAAVHRSYAMKGTDIQVKIFDDRLEVISPGIFPGLINEYNILDTHYSRNPRIARVATEFGFVKEMGEGINRMVDEMVESNLPKPGITERAHMEVAVILKNRRARHKSRKGISSNTFRNRN